MGDQVVYLEKFVEGTSSLPPELQRILNTIKDLDERSEDLAAQIQDNVELVLQKPPAQGRTGAGSGSARSSAAADEVADLRSRIDSDQRLLVQFAEEKVQLAVAGYDLLDSHLNQLDLDIHDLQEELAATLGALGEALGDTYSLGGDEAPASKRSTRLRDVPSFDSLDPSIDVRQQRKNTTTITLSLSRQASGMEMEAATPGTEAQRRPASAARKATQATPVAAAAASTPGSGLGEAYQPRRRAASAAVHAAAAAVAAMEEDESQDDPAAAPSGDAVDAGITAGPAAAAASGLPGQAATAGGQPAHALPPFVPGLRPSAQQPQAPGRLLTTADISEALVGRVAELFWPNDGLWYLIRFESVDPASRTAHILYNTGEEERAVGLDDLCRDGHCSLLQ